MGIKESQRPYLNLGFYLSLGILFFTPMDSPPISYLLIGLGIYLFIVTVSGILILEGIHHVRG